MTKQNGKFLAEVIGNLNGFNWILLDSERNLIYTGQRGDFTLGEIVEVLAQDGEIVLIRAI